MKKMPTGEKKLDPQKSLKTKAEQSSDEKKKKKTKQSRAEVSEPKLPLRPLEIFVIDLKKEFRNNPSVNYDELGAEEWKIMPESGKARYEEMWKTNKEEYDQAMIKYIKAISENADSGSEEESEKPASDDQTSTSGNES